MVRFLSFVGWRFHRGRRGPKPAPSPLLGQHLLADTREEVATADRAQRTPLVAVAPHCGIVLLPGRERLDGAPACALERSHTVVRLPQVEQMPFLAVAHLLRPCGRGPGRLELVADDGL